MTRAERLENVQTLIQDAIRLRYVNGGLIAGGGAVVVAMLIGAPDLQAESIAGLSSVYAALLLMQTLLVLRVLPNPYRMRLLRPSISILLFNIGILYIAISGSRTVFPFKAYDTSWWFILTVAFLLTIDGAEGRILTERMIDQLQQAESALKDLAKPKVTDLRRWKRRSGAPVPGGRPQRRARRPVRQRRRHAAP